MRVGQRITAGHCQWKLPLFGRLNRCGCGSSRSFLQVAEWLAAVGHEFFANIVGRFGSGHQHQLLKITRVVTFVEQLLADENDTGVAETLSLPGQRFGHLLFAVFDEGDGIAFDAQTKSMPLSVVHPDAEIDLQRRMSGAFFLALVIMERHCFADRNDQLLIASVVVHGEKNGIDALSRSQGGNYAEILGESLWEDLCGGDSEHGPLSQPVGLICFAVRRNSIVDGDGPLIADSGRVHHSQRQLADTNRIQ